MGFRKSLLSLVLSGITAFNFPNNTSASFSNSHLNYTGSARQELLDLRKEEKFPQKLVKIINFSYEEWKAAIEKPYSNEAANLRTRALIMKDVSTLAFESLSEDEKTEYETFWKTFVIDEGSIRDDGTNKEYSRAISLYAKPVIKEFQKELKKIYDPDPLDIEEPKGNLEMGEIDRQMKVERDRMLKEARETNGIQDLFDFSNLNLGQRTIIFLHFKYRSRYLSEGHEMNDF